MLKIRLGATLVTVAMLVGCVAPGTTVFNVELPQVADADNVPLGSCYVVTRVNVRDSGVANKTPAHLLIRSGGLAGGFYNAGIFAAPSGSSFRVVAFSPGTYLWRELMIGGYSSGVFKNDFPFQCVERRVTYIGDVDLFIDWTTKKYAISFVDRFGRAVSDYAAEYPVLAQKNPLVSGVVIDPRNDQKPSPGR